MYKKVLLLFLFFAFIPLLFGGFFGVRMLSREAARGYEETLRQSVAFAARSLGTFFVVYRHQLTTALNMPLVCKVLEKSPEDRTYAAESTRLRAEFKKRMGQLLFVEQILLCDPQGRVLVSGTSHPGEMNCAFNRDLPAFFTSGRWISPLCRCPVHRDRPPHFAISQPVIVDGTLRGAVLYVLNTDMTESISRGGNLLDTGRLTLVDGEGNIVASNDAELRQRQQHAGAPLYGHVQNNLPQVKGWFTYHDPSGTERIGYSKIVPGTDWVLLSSVAVEEKDEQTSFSRLLYILLALSIPYALLVSWAVRRYVTAGIDAVLERANMFRRENNEAPLARTRGDVADIAEALDILIGTITRAEERNSLSERQYRTALQMTNDHVFDINLAEGAVDSAAKNDPFFSATYDELLRRLAERIPDEERGAFLATLDPESLRRGFAGTASTLTLEYRMLDVDNMAIWHTCSVVSLLGRDGMQHAILLIKNIHADKLRELTLQRRAERDGLTHLYNKSTARRLAEAELAGSGRERRHALFLIDVDNFKGVNDTLGHMFGDAVLGEVSRHLQSTFRESDIIGRMGGDEFMVLMRDVGDVSRATRKADDLVDFLDKSFNGTLRELGVSTSVGLAMYPGDGFTLEQLYQAADNALYVSKSHGKNRWTLYREDMAHQIPSVGRETARITEACGPRTSVQKTFKDNLVEYIFSILYSSKDTLKAIPHILALIGSHFNVSRVYIFERSEDGRYYSNTMEWCNKGIQPEIDNLRWLPAETLTGYEACFNEDGVFYCADISVLPPHLRSLLERQGITSVLQCALLEDTVLRGMIGFDECTGNRIWTEEEVETLSLVGKIVGTFLLKSASGLSNQAMLNAFETIDAWIYIVDIDNYTLLYMNKKTREMEKSKEGKKFCYAVLRGNTAPCVDCPVLRLREMPENETTSAALYNKQYGIWVWTTTGRTRWYGHANACIICCQDITPFMKDVRDAPEGEAG